MSAAPASMKPNARSRGPGAGLRMVPPSLEDAAAGRGLLMRGMRDEGDTGPVHQLQQMLKDRGYDVKVDGTYGRETAEAVRQFQIASGAKRDGVVGPETMGFLQGSDDVAHRTSNSDRVVGGPSRSQGVLRAPTEGERRAPLPSGTVRAGDLARADEARRARGNNAPNGAVTLAPEGMSERQRYDHYAAIVRANGGEVCPGGRPTVLGIRGLSRDGGGPHETGSTRRYDDTFVVLTPDGRVRELRGATHPGQNRSTMSPDADGRGGGDVGMIHAGNYSVVSNGLHDGNPSFHVRTMDGSGRLPGVRDTNHDGRFDAAEQAASARRSDTLTGVLFHPGTANAPRSIGCQTLPPDEYTRFLGAIGGPRASFNYTLVDAAR